MGDVMDEGCDHDGGGRGGRGRGEVMGRAGTAQHSTVEHSPHVAVVKVTRGHGSGRRGAWRLTIQRSAQENVSGDT
jgi:hypothetical protein